MESEPDIRFCAVQRGTKKGQKSNPCLSLEVLKPLQGFRRHPLDGHVLLLAPLVELHHALVYLGRRLRVVVVVVVAREREREVHRNMKPTRTNIDRRDRNGGHVQQ